MDYTKQIREAAAAAEPVVRMTGEALRAFAAGFRASRTDEPAEDAT